MSLPVVIAHRGFAAHYPENTLVALQAAAAAGATWIEFDVQLSGDGVPVLLHDVTLQRTGTRSDSVFALDSVRLGACNAGEPRRFGARFADVTVPTLSEVVDWLQSQSHLTACVEIKTESIRRFGVDVVRKAVARTLEPVLDQCVLISFDNDYLCAARRAVPMRLGWVIAAWNEVAERRARALAPELLFVDHRLLPPESAALWSGGWRWAVYEVTDAAQALALAARGIDYVESMAVGALLADMRSAAGRA